MNALRRSVIALLLVVGIAGSSHAQSSGDGWWWCGATGFNINLGVTTKSFRCGIVKVVRGTGTLTFNATTTVTASLNGFANVVTPDAIPGADAVFFKTSGLVATVGGSTHFLRVSAKASSTSLTALEGTGATAFSGTTTVWGYWNTLCYRTAAASGDSTVAVDANVIDARLFPSISEFDRVSNASTNGGFFLLNVQGAAGAAGSFSSLKLKPVAYSGSFIVNGGTLGTTQATAQIGNYSAPFNFTGLSTVGQGWCAILQSHTADTFPVTCIYAVKTQ